jgi:hypothetical protein
MSLSVLLDTLLSGEASANESWSAWKQWKEMERLPRGPSMFSIPSVLSTIQTGRPKPGTAFTRKHHVFEQITRLQAAPSHVHSPPKNTFRNEKWQRNGNLASEDLRLDSVEIAEVKPILTQRVRLEKPNPSKWDTPTEEREIGWEPAFSW